MLVPTSALIAACWFTTLVLGSTLPLSIEGQSLPDKWFQMSLNETVAVNTGVIARDVNSSYVDLTPITACERTVTFTGSCVTITKFVIGLAKSLASTIKELSDQGNCNSMTGTYESLKWTYHSSGRNCDTTAQHATIAGAIKKYLTTVEHDRVCGTQCLRLDHGGTWDGWLKLGPIKGFDDRAYCGPSLTFHSCISGGNHDI